LFDLAESEAPAGQPATARIEPLPFDIIDRVARLSIREDERTEYVLEPTEIIPSVEIPRTEAPAQDEGEFNSPRRTSRERKSVCYQGR